ELVIDRYETPFESRDIETIGLRAWPLSELFFDGIEVPAINLLGAGRPGASLLAQRTDRRRQAPDFRDARMCALASCGIAQRALEMALGYVKERKQFGREIGRFQLVQALLADMAMELEAARLLAYRARQLIAMRLGDAEASMAKAYATEMAVRVTSKALECFGAMGLTREAYIERLYRDARMWIVPDGTAQIQRLVIGRELTGFSAIHGWGRASRRPGCVGGSTRGEACRMAPPPKLRHVDATHPPGLFTRAYAALAATRLSRFVSRHVSWKLDPVLLR